ncbi:hypothetical protein PoB_001324400 [Plakobranchus ocellatus]|uniref:Uncharacterized protein n=1 Tax=Plakobranchus ocellatus TaxID=259542 RepID=A0AAV3YYC6_9GAST|nr:hypothetical protein PoB_001324400 [Plakobranchus ocellatus]
MGQGGVERKRKDKVGKKDRVRGVERKRKDKVEKKDRLLRHSIDALTRLSPVITMPVFLIDCEGRLGHTASHALTETGYLSSRNFWLNCS